MPRDDEGRAEYDEDVAAIREVIRASMMRRQRKRRKRNEDKNSNARFNLGDADSAE